MDINAVTTIISSLGFPIAMCCALFWYMTKQRESHAEEAEKWREVLDGNTRILTKLYEKLGGSTDDN